MPKGKGYGKRKRPTLPSQASPKAGSALSRTPGRQARPTMPAQAKRTTRSTSGMSPKLAQQANARARQALKKRKRRA